MLYKLLYSENENGTTKNENGTMKMRTLQYNTVQCIYGEMSLAITYLLTKYCTIPS